MLEAFQILTLILTFYIPCSLGDDRPSQEAVIGQAMLALNAALERYNCSMLLLCSSIRESSGGWLPMEPTPWRRHPGIGSFVNYDIAPALVVSAVFKLKPLVTNTDSLSCPEFNTTDKIFHLSKVLDGSPTAQNPQSHKATGDKLGIEHADMLLALCDKEGPRIQDVRMCRHGTATVAWTLFDVVSGALRFLFRRLGFTPGFQQALRSRVRAITEQLPERYNALHIRAGDKLKKESRHLAKYVTNPAWMADWVSSGTDQQKPLPFFIFSDHCGLARNVSELLNHSHGVRSVVACEAAKGHSQRHWNSHHTCRDVLEFFASVEVAVQAVQYWGSLKSNVGRLVAGLRGSRLVAGPLCVYLDLGPEELFSCIWTP